MPMDMKAGRETTRVTYNSLMPYMGVIIVWNDSAKWHLGMDDLK